MNAVILIPLSEQEHFYLETQSVLAVPKDVGELEMFVSTQNAHKTQVSLYSCHLVEHICVDVSSCCYWCPWKPGSDPCQKTWWVC